MKKFNMYSRIAAILISGLFIASITSCGGDDEPGLLSKKITTSGDLIIEMTWTIDDQEVGYQYVDVDFVLDDLEQGTSYENSAGNSFDFEEEAVYSDDLDGTYHLGVFIYEFEDGQEAYNQSENIRLTLTFYASDDTSNKIVFKQKITHEAFDDAGLDTISKLTITKSGDEYEIKELAKAVVLQNGYNSN